MRAGCGSYDIPPRIGAPCANKVGSAKDMQPQDLRSDPSCFRIDFSYPLIWPGVLYWVG